MTPAPPGNESEGAVLHVPTEPRRLLVDARAGGGMSEVRSPVDGGLVSVKTDSLKRLVREYDSRRNSTRQLEVTARESATTLICIACRRVPDREAYRARWLKAHPLPRRWCRTLCYASNSVTDRADHKRWHLDLYVSNNMPRFEACALKGKCPDCGGRLESVTW